MSNETRNAQIVDTFLGWEDHGLFVLHLELDYGGTHQGYQRIIATRADSDYNRLGSLLRVIGVESWEQLKGRYCRADVRDGLIHRLGNITRDVWTTEGLQNG